VLFLGYNVGWEEERKMESDLPLRSRNKYNWLYNSAYFNNSQDLNLPNTSEIPKYTFFYAVLTSAKRTLAASLPIPLLPTSPHFAPKTPITHKTRRGSPCPGKIKLRRQI